MKKNAALLFMDVLLLAALLILFISTRNPMEKTYAQDKSLLLMASQTELDMENEFLKNKNMASVTFENMDKVQKDVGNLCLKMQSEEYKMYHRLSQRIDMDIDQYCQILNAKLKNLEVFRAQQMNLRDSLAAMQGLVSDPKLIFRPEHHGIHHQLIRQSMNYALSSSSDIKDNISLLLKKAQVGNAEMPCQGLMKLMPLVARVAEAKESIDSLTPEIINPQSHQILQAMRIHYLNVYSQWDGRIQFFRDFLLCMGLLVMAILGFHTVIFIKTEKTLQNSRENLKLGFQFSLWKVRPQYQFIERTTERSKGERLRGSDLSVI